jgi:hypothetical protein
MSEKRKTPEEIEKLKPFYDRFVDDMQALCDDIVNGRGDMQTMCSHFFDGNEVE